MKMDKYNQFMYQEVKKYLMGEHPLIEVKERRAFLYEDNKLAEHIRYELVKFTNAYINKKESSSLIEIKQFNQWEPIKFNLNKNEIKEVENKIKKIKSPKLKMGFDGILNLIKDEKNLVYNPLYTRKQILKDFKSFKSFNEFKVSYINPADLKKQYGFLAVKKNCDKNHTKLHRINYGLYVLKTITHDGISLKCFYIFNNVKTLIRTKKITKRLPKQDKFNLSCLNAYKTLSKEDSVIFYGYCNRNGLDKSNRDLLRSIHKAGGGMTFSCFMEQVQDKINRLEEKIASNPYDYYLLEELYELEDMLTSFKEEHNSDEVKTVIEDYY